jgi:hypothetical protein
VQKMDALEISTGIGCPVGCLEFCPQEVTIKRYYSLFGEKSPRLMSLDTFERILQQTPNNVSITFAGYFEPFANPQFVDMLKLANEQQRRIDLFTTLWGIRKENIEELSKIQFNQVCLHLPDGKYMREPMTDNYRDLFFEFQTSVSRIHYMSMNGYFKSNNRENVVRGAQEKPKAYGYCPRFHEAIAPVVLPNGATYLCCNDFGLRNYVGNLMEESYSTIKKRIVQNEGQFKECQFCSWNQPLVGHALSSTMTRVASIVKNIG